jgi:ABC-type sugar transport system substrate-binding protein
VGGQLSVTLPNEHAVRVAGFGGPTPDVPMIETGVGIVTVLQVPMQYVATAADAEDGVLKVQADYGATPLRPDQENGVYLTQPPLPEASRTAVTSVTFNAAP